MLQIPTAIFRQMIDQAQAEEPVEACGILAGRDCKIEKLYTMTNADNSSTHFMMEPEQQFAVARDVRSAGLEMLAIYHSHPATPARLSDEDIRLALTPGVTYVVVSLLDAENPAIKGFNIENGSVTEVPLEIVE